MSEEKRKPVILAVSFGTSHKDTREKTIGAIEKLLEKEFPGFEIRRAFTSKIIMKILRKRDGIEVDSVKEALERLADEGVRRVVVQPTHVMEGIEYELIQKDAEEFKGRFESLKMGRGLLTSEDDIRELIKVIDEDTAGYAGEDTARVFMGHGTDHSENSVYARMQKEIYEAGIRNMFVATVEAEPSLEDAVKAAKKSGAKKVLLSPLMIVAGDHAKNDMAGDGEDSWKSVFEREGFEVLCRIEGLGSSAGVQRMIAEHCRKTVEE